MEWFYIKNPDGFPIDCFSQSKFVMFKKDIKTIQRLLFDVLGLLQKNYKLYIMSLAGFGIHIIIIMFQL